MIQITATDRYRITRLRAAMTNVFSLAAGLLVISITFLIAGVNPLFAIAEIFQGSFGSLYGFKETITKAIPLILIGAGLTLAFRAKFWNIGAEGQLLMGAVFATWTGLTFGESLPSAVIIPLMFAAGFLGGALWGIIPAVLKIRYAINEVISTLMLNYICAHIVTMLIVGPWKGGTQFGFPGTDTLPEAAILSVIPGSRIHYVTLTLALICAALLTVLIYRTRFGYEARVVGENPDAGKYAGIDFLKTTLILMAVSGGMAGMAGVGEVAGIHQYLGYPDSMSSGYGFTAFIVTMATGSPWLGVLAAMMAGMVISVIHAVASMTLQANQVVSGLALTMLGLGLSGMMGQPYVGKPLTIKMEDLSIPVLSDIPYIGQAVFHQSPFFFLAVILALVSWFLLERTRLGIQIRSTGENPKATETQGVNVFLIRYVSVIIGGGFSALAGAHLSISYSKSWIEGMTAGRGWIAIALTIFALWNPGRAIWAAFLFGGIFVVQYLMQPLGISPNFLSMLPYIATLLILLIISLKDPRKLNAPAMLSSPYKRGER